MSDRLQPGKKRGGSGEGQAEVPYSPGDPGSGGSGGFRRGRRPPTPAGLGRELSADDDFARAIYPAIVDYLTRRVVDGKVIDTATLLLFAEEGQWKVCLNDRDAGVVVFRGGQSIQDALGSLETALVDGTADWRERKGPGRR